jgi:uncharacterized protein YggT (Ycf19 family)
MVGDVLCFGILLFTFAFYLRIALSWFPARTGGPMMQVREAAFTVTEPVLLPLRRAIPPLPGAVAGFGIAEIALLLILSVLTRIICSI